MRNLRRLGLSTALATIAIILVLTLSLTWMAYTVVLNARQQAVAAERAESIALKAKELIRVYVWMDPARQPDGTYLNLTRISFVGSWSGETTINGLLVVYRDGSSRMLGANIKLAAGEERTYLPSELGIPGLDDYDAFRRAVKYVQAHTSLGNDFVSLWGRPDRPAIYLMTTTTSDTNTTTTTTTTMTDQPPTTTTTTGSTTSTSTVTSTVTQTVTSTLTSTFVVSSPIRCISVIWEGAELTVTRTSTWTETYWGIITTTITHTTTETTTSTNTITVWRTVTSTLTYTEEVWVAATKWVYSWTTSTSTWTLITTVTHTVYYTWDSFERWIFPSFDPDGSCGFGTMVMSQTAYAVQPSTSSMQQVPPELLLLTLGLVFYGSYGRRLPVGRVVRMLSPYGLAALLIVAAFMAGPMMEAAAQVVTTTITTTTTSYVTSVVVSTREYCTTTITVTSTTTGTITIDEYVYVATTVGPTSYVTTTVTTTSTSYTTSTMTRTYVSYTRVTTTRTYTYTVTSTSTLTSVVDIVVWTTSVSTSTSNWRRCGVVCRYYPIIPPCFCLSGVSP